MPRLRLSSGVHAGSPWEGDCSAPLDSHTRLSWEGYLDIPPGRLQIPAPGAYTMLALHGQKVVGHVSVFRQWEKTDVAVPGWWLTGLEVIPRWRGIGVGRQLVHSVITMWEREHHEEPLYLVVNRRNTPASGLFLQYGFKELKDPEWERKLRRAYRQDRRGEWVYQILKRNPVDQ